ncbi:uncharacterized protein LTR77_007174 [Saxophila tyrrhenica]|uniref:Cytochrome P450 n=1 Tax=Saxophila tyrrhenica TaxID=1690608 RepID=A0AAV9P4N1_9PEZI|nr:hypothetical protein LTR77_007174 [Saxophila tyrrhenica]
MEDSRLPVFKALESMMDLESILFLSISIFVFWVVVSGIYNLYISPLRKIPGPRIRALSNVPRIWEMMAGRDGIDHIDLHRVYGPIHDIYGPRKGHAAPPAKDKLFYQPPYNGVDSILGIDDEAAHKQERKIMSAGFSERSLRDQEPLLKSWATKLGGKLREQAIAGNKADLVKFYNLTTFDIMADLTFGESLNMLENEEYTPWVQTIFAWLSAVTALRGLRLLGPTPRLLIDRILMRLPAVRRLDKEHWEYSTARVRKRLQREPDHPDLWSHILQKSDISGTSLERNFSNASVFMIAGTETTATALSGTTYHLLRNPAYLSRLKEELRSQFFSTEELTFESLARLPYLHAVLQEGMRMYPPVPAILPRIVPKGGLAICGEWVPAGTVVGVHQLATYRMEEHFSKPDEFHPQRWLKDLEFAKDQLNALEPFSVGPRDCLGKNLAWHEMRLLLATVLFQFDIQLSVESENWAEQSIYTLWQKKPLVCSLEAAAQ